MLGKLGGAVSVTDVVLVRAASPFPEALVLASVLLSGGNSEGSADIFDEIVGHPLAFWPLGLPVIVGLDKADEDRGDLSGAFANEAGSLAGVRETDRIFELRTAEAFSWLRKRGSEL